MLSGTAAPCASNRADVIGHADTCAHDDFDAWGGDSLSASAAADAVLGERGDVIGDCRLDGRAHAWQPGPT